MSGDSSGAAPEGYMSSVTHTCRIYPSKQLKADVVAKEEAAATLQAELAALATTVSAARSEAGAAQARVAELTMEAEQLATAQATLQEQLAARDAAASEAADTVAKMQEDITRLDALNAELRSAMDAKVHRVGEGQEGQGCAEVQPADQPAGCLTNLPPANPLPPHLPPYGHPPPQVAELNAEAKSLTAERDGLEREADQMQRDMQVGGAGWLAAVVGVMKGSGAGCPDSRHCPRCLPQLTLLHAARKHTCRRWHASCR